jgi:hypothetical protein
MSLPQLAPVHGGFPRPVKDFEERALVYANMIRIDPKWDSLFVDVHGELDEWDVVQAPVEVAMKLLLDPQRVAKDHWETVVSVKVFLAWFVKTIS